MIIFVKRNIRLFLGLQVWILLFLLSCSNQKNTTITRSYHNLTAHFNVFFNGEESYKKGLKKIDLAFKDDYSRILPVFTYSDDEIAKSVIPEMDVSIKKGAKLITLHSIKAKPNVKKGRMTPQEKEFYNRNEYNKWVDDAYLLMGKANFYKHEFQAAADNFNFVVREFPKQPAQYEAMIWQARINIENKEYKDAERTLTILQGEKKFPKKLEFDLYSTVADVALKQGQYEVGIKPLIKALDLAKSKRIKLRYTYILAQLYQTNGKLKEASDMYTRIIRKSPPYEMSFNARINLAATVEAGAKNAQYVKTQLRKMLRDEKNIDFQDQIYYALGNIEMKENNETQAIEYYRKSVKVSVKNPNQKGLSCITLADLYYEKKKYIPAQAYYDSALLNINESYPGYINIKSKAGSLNRLVENLNSISREDSLQRIAKLPENERLRIIDGIIGNLRKKESEEQFAEAQRLQDYYNNQSRRDFGQDPTAQAKWYFYNPVSVSQGLKDFQLRWGKRRLEDNWRRRNKGVSSFGNESELAQTDKKIETDKKLVADNKSREFYTQNLPTTDSLMRASHKKVIDGYFNAGQVYRNDLNDLSQAVLIYEQMLQRFPENEYKLPVYFQQYLMYTDLKNTERAGYYKNLIVTKHPESVFAKILMDPEYYKQLLGKTKESDNYYETTFNLYNTGNYSQVIENSNNAFKQYKNDNVLPKFALLKAMAIGKSSDLMTFRAELNNLIAQYPKSEVSTRAKELLAYLNTYKPETKQQEDIKIAEVTYILEEKPVYYFALVVDRKEDVNQIVFDIINFNLDNFPTIHLEINNEELGKSFRVVVIKSFTEKDKALAYYNTFVSKPSVLKDVKNATRTMVIISPSNLQLMEKQESADSYFEFFKKHFL